MTKRQLLQSTTSAELAELIAFFIVKNQPKDKPENVEDELNKAFGQ